MNKEDNIPNLLKQNLEGLEAFVDSGQWNVLATNLNAYDRKRILTLWSSAFIGVLLMTVVGLTFYLNIDEERGISNKINFNQLDEPMDLNQETNRTSKDLGNGIDNEQTYKRDVEKKGSPASSEEKLKRRIKENRDIEPIESTFMPEEMVLVPRNTKFDISIVSVLPDYLLLPEEQARFIGKDDEKKCKGGWEIGLMTTPSIANKILKTDGTNGWLVNRDFFGISNGSERATLGFQTSLTVQFNLSSKWFIQSGITYSEKRESVSYNHIIKDEIIVSQTERKLLYLPAPKVQWINVTGSANNKYSFLELPFYAGFKHSFNNKLEWRLRGGVSYLRLLAKEGIKVDPTLLVLNDLSESKIYTKSNIGFAINSGVYYKLGPAMKILIEPGASISITNLTRIGSPLVTRPYNYGLNIGLQYIIK